jgi:HD-GYP domain-containing protein (c-di-GMP phosphodiesterase class II)
MTPLRTPAFAADANADTPVLTLSVEEACAYGVDALALALEMNDYRRGRFAETGDHADRVTASALELAHAVTPDLVSDPQLVWGFRLHDIGMLGVSPAIRAQPAPLDAHQLDEVREHPWLGERIVASVPYLSGLARQVIGCHLEKWNGPGIHMVSRARTSRSRRASSRSQMPST